jgi:hypothetical protein
MCAFKFWKELFLYTLPSKYTSDICKNRCILGEEGDKKNSPFTLNTASV